MAGLLVLPAIGPAQAEIDPYMKVKLDADALATSMQTLHGRKCRVCVDHQTPMVVIIADG